MLPDQASTEPDQEVLSRASLVAAKGPRTFPRNIDAT